MSDPFSRKNSEQQLVREAKIGFSLLLCALLTIGGWSYYQYTKFRHQIPQQVLNAPVAHHVGADYYLRNLHQQNPVRTFEYPGQRIATSLPSNPNGDTSSEPDLILEISDPLVSQNPISVARPKQSNFQVTPLPPISAKDEPRQSLPVVVSLPNPFKPSADDISNQFLQRQQTSLSNSSQTDGLAATTKQPQSNSVAASLPNRQTQQTDDQVVRDEAVVRTAFAQSGEPTTDFVPAKKDFTASPFKQPPHQTTVDRTLDAARQQTATQATPLKSPFDSPDQPSRTPPADPTEIKTSVAPVDQQHDHQTQYAATVPTDQYETKPGDSFWSIAQQAYGDGRYFRALFQHNRLTVDAFENISVGTQLKIPTLKTLQTAYTELCPQDSITSTFDDSSVYKTADGDTLFDIARKTTGQASRYLEILKLNRDTLPPNVGHLTRLDAGISLTLPE